MPHRLNEQTTAQLRETLQALRAAGLSVAQAIDTVLPTLRASAEVIAQLLSPGAVSSEVEKRLKP